jgi:hypothetical protein
MDKVRLQPFRAAIVEARKLARGVGYLWRFGKGPEGVHRFLGADRGVADPSDNSGWHCRGGNR